MDLKVLLVIRISMLSNLNVKIYLKLARDYQIEEEYSS